MQYKIRTALLSLLAALVLLTSMPLPVQAVLYTPNTDIQAQAYYLYSMENDKLVAEKNSAEPMYPASLTKIMTCILALENTSNLDTEMLTYPNYIQDYLYSYQMREGSVSLGGLLAGETLSMRQLLYACMLPSANEAAMIIADHIAGSQEAFAEMMTQRAKELGATNTNFVNANGLHDPNHYTTAQDMAKITLHAMELDEFMDIVSAPYYESGPTNLHDNIVWNTTITMQVSTSSSYYPGLRGVKTGSVPEAGDCFISTCTRDGFTYLLVLLGSQYLDEEGNYLPKRGSFVDAANIYDWVFDNFRRKSLVDKGTHVAEVSLRLSMEKDYIKLMTGERLTSLVPKDTEVSDVQVIPEIPETVDAPVEKGDYIGELRLILGGEELGTVPLLAAESAEASSLLVLWESVKNIMSSFWFKFGVILVVLLIILYIVLMILRNRNRKRGGYRPRRRI